MTAKQLPMLNISYHCSHANVIPFLVTTSNAVGSKISFNNCENKKCKIYGLTVLVLVIAQSNMHIVFQLYDVLRFDSTVVIDVLISISSPKLNNQIFKFSEQSA